MTTQSDAADVLERIHGLACRLSGHLLASHLSVDYNAQGRAIYVNDCERCKVRIVKRFAASATGEHIDHHAHGGTTMNDRPSSGRFASDVTPSR